VRAPARIALLVAALTLVACGRDSPSDAVRKSVERFGKDVAAQDYNDLCKNVLAANLINALEDSGVPCELALKTGFAGVKDPKLTIRSVAVNGARALANVHSTASNQPPSDDTLSLTKEKGKWRISSLARPQPQAPRKP
jgi:hypothetical protein